MKISRGEVVAMDTETVTIRLPADPETGATVEVTGRLAPPVAIGSDAVILTGAHGAVVVGAAPGGGGGGGAVVKFDTYQELLDGITI